MVKNIDKILKSDAAYEILDNSNCNNSTWTEGGCAILAQALNKLEGYPIYVIYNTKFKSSEHFGVMTIQGTILDAYGEHKNKNSWLNFFKENEMPRPGELIVIPFNSSVDMKGINFDNEASDKLAELIKNHKMIRETVRNVLKEDLISEVYDIQYKSWKRKNVTIRGIREVGSENNAGAMLGRGLYTAPLSNKDLAKQYGNIHFVIGAIPKSPKVFNNLNEWEIWFYNTMVFKFSKLKGNEFPDIRDFNTATTIEDEMQKLGYDGIIIKGREMVNFNPPNNIIYFSNENELFNYYNETIRYNVNEKHVVSELIENSKVYTKEIDSSYNDDMFKLIGNQFPSYGTSVIGLFDRDKLIGGVLLERDYLPWEYRFDIVINKRYRNKGYSSVLIKALIDKFNKDKEAEQLSAIVINDKLMRVLDKFNFYEDEFDGMRMAFLNKEKINEDVEFKDIGDDDGYWDRVKIIAKNKKGEEVGYAILDMAMSPESEFGYLDDDNPAKFSDEEIEKHFPDDFSAKLEHIEVRESHRDKGFGKELMNAVVKYVKERGYKTLYLIASPIGVKKIELDALTNFYKKYGFNVVKDFGNARDMVAQIDESALRTKDLPETAALFVRDVNQGYDFFIYDPAEKRVYGTITIVQRDEFGSDYFVSSVAAEKGYGPFMYEIAMMHVGRNNKGLMPTRDGAVRGEALNIWNQFYERMDIKKKKISPNSPYFKFNILFSDDDFESEEEKQEWLQDADSDDIKTLKVFNTVYYLDKDEQYKELLTRANKLIRSGFDIQKAVDDAENFWFSQYF